MCMPINSGNSIIATVGLYFLALGVLGCCCGNALCCVLGCTVSIYWTVTLYLAVWCIIQNIMQYLKHGIPLKTYNKVKHQANIQVMRQMPYDATV